MTRRELKHVLIQVVIFKDLAEQPLEVIALSRKGAGNLAFQQADVVIEGQSDAGKRDRRSKLRCKREIFPGEAKLAKKPDQRPFFGSFGGVVCNGVQSDVVVATSQAIKRVHTADGIVPLQNADAL